MGVASEGVSTSRHFVYCIYSQVGQRGYSNRGGKVDKTKKGSMFFTMQEGSKFQGPMTGPVLAETDSSSGKRSREKQDTSNEMGCRACYPTAHGWGEGEKWIIWLEILFITMASGSHVLPEGKLCCHLGKGLRDLQDI